MENINKELLLADAQLNKLGGASAGLRVLLGALGGIPTALENAEKKASSLDSFLKFANGLESVGKLQQALGTVNKTVTATQADIKAAFGTVDRFELGKKLADPNIANNDAARKAIEEYLELLSKRDQLQEKISKMTEEQAKREIAAFEQVTERKKALGLLSLQEERARIEQQLGMVKRGTDEEIQLLEQLASKDLEILSRREELAKSALEKRISQIEESVANVSKAPGAGAEEVSGALEGAIAALEAFGGKQKALFAGAPEAAEAYRQKLVELKRELASSEAAELEENFKKLKEQIEDGIDENGTTAAQLVEVGEAIISLNAAMASKTVDQAAGDEFLAQLEEKKLDLMRQQTAEKLKQVDEIAALQQAALDQEIQILEARLAAGENVERQLGEAQRARLELQTENIMKATEREIAGGANRVLAEEKASLLLTTLYKKEALSKYQAAAKANSDIEQLGRRRGRGQASGSGVASFQPSFQPQGGGFGATPFSQGGLVVSVNPTALPDFAQDFGRRIVRRPPAAPSFDNFFRQAKEQAGEAKRVGPGSFSTLPDRPANHTDVKMTVNVDGMAADPDARAAAEANMKLARKRHAMLTGRDGAEASGSPMGVGMRFS